MLFGENTIELNGESVEQRRERIKTRQAELEREAAEKLARAEENEGYDD